MKDQRPQPSVRFSGVFHPAQRAVGLLFNRSWFRRGLFLLACMVVFVALFYAEEDWRGKRAWDQCKRQMRAKGAVLDWNAYIPAPVPDDQNAFEAPRMREWFVLENGFLTVQRPPAARSAGPALAWRKGVHPRPVTLAQVEFTSVETNLDKADTILRWDDPDAPDQLHRMLLAVVGPNLQGSASMVLFARPLDRVAPGLIVVAASSMSAQKQVRDFVQGQTFGSVGLLLERSGASSFRVELAGANGHYDSAADYLAWSGQFDTNLDAIREALKRPCARMAGSYERPLERPIPNFVEFRSVAQALAQRAQCRLLLGQPEAAMSELTLFHGLSRLLNAKPTPLVSTMIDTALAGVYTGVVADGLRLGAWHEPQLAALQQQLEQIDLLPSMSESLAVARAESLGSLESMGAGESAALSSHRQRAFLWFLHFRMGPRGWVYQNMRSIALAGQSVIELLDNPGVIPARRMDSLNRQFETMRHHFSPYSFFSAIAIPNYLLAAGTVARNQTLVHEAFTACALERYRLARGQYPETLDALIPQFAGKLPHDVIDGQPLKYRRTADGRFFLYSVGWNEKDDGGVPGKSASEGDWVWQ
jgi:hypothetical protein